MIWCSLRHLIRCIELASGSEVTVSTALELLRAGAKLQYTIIDNLSVMIVTGCRFMASGIKSTLRPPLLADSGGVYGSHAF